MRRLVPGVSIVVISVCAFGSARAQNVDAEALFREAEQLEAAGKDAEACDAFEASNRLEARAGTLIRLGQCRERRQQLASAWSAYTDALVRVKDPKKRQLATTRVAELEPRLSKLAIRVPEAKRVDGLVIKRNGKTVDPALWNRALPVDGGDYVIEGAAPGAKGWTKNISVPVERGDVTVDLFVDEPKPIVVAPPVVAPPPPRPVVPPVQTDDRGWFARLPAKRKLALGVGAGGTVAIATGVAFGMVARNKQRDARALCPEPMACEDADRANELIDTAQQRALVANVAFGVGAAALIGGGVLWFLGAPARGELAVAGHPGGVVVSGRF